MGRPSSRFMTALQFDSQPCNCLRDCAQQVVEEGGFRLSTLSHSATVGAISVAASASAYRVTTATAVTFLGLALGSRSFGFWAKIIRTMTIWSDSVLVCHLKHSHPPAADGRKS